MRVLRSSSTRSSFSAQLEEGRESEGSGCRRSKPTATSGRGRSSASSPPSPPRSGSSRASSPTSCGRGKSPSVHDEARCRGGPEARQEPPVGRAHPATHRRGGGPRAHASELNVEGAASMPPGRRITKRGAYYSQTPKERARARGKSDAELQELGIRTVDAIAKDAENLQQLYRNLQKLDKSTRTRPTNPSTTWSRSSRPTSSTWTGPPERPPVDNVLRALEDLQPEQGDAGLAAPQRHEDAAARPPGAHRTQRDGRHRRDAEGHDHARPGSTPSP